MIVIFRGYGFTGGRTFHFPIDFWMGLTTVTLVIFMRLICISLSDANVTGQILFSRCFEWLSLAWQFSSHSSGSLRFLNTTISQGSVATRLRCGGVYNYFVTRNLLLSLLMKEFWKSVSIWQSKLEAKIEWFNFFRTRCRISRGSKLKWKSFDFEKCFSLVF